MDTPTYGLEVSKKIKVLLLENDKSTTELANALGISRSTLYTKLSKGKFSLEDLDKISNELHVSYEVNFIKSNE